ncbi:MAG: IS21 family transposase [Candidatus Auribacterota bacterium]|nr:IS21 family transposase [Candidatus Auribacterota bacterium]
MNQIKEIVRLKELKMSQRQIARALKISHPTVINCIHKISRNNLSFNDIKDLPDSTLSEIIYGQRKRSTRYEMLSRHFPGFLKELKRKGVTLQLLWEEYKEKNPEGLMYSQFCEHFKKWRKASKVTLHIEHRAGDKMFADFAGTKMSIVDRKTGKEKELEIFAASLGASQLTYVEAVESQKKEDWIKVNENALRYFGGVPKAIVPDCLKSAVSKGCKYEPDINPEYYAFASHYGTTILPARPYRPQDKAIVENTVKIVYRRIYAPLRNKTFYSRKELNEAILELLEKHNNTNFQNLPYSRRDLFNDVEKNVLRQLPFQRYEFKEFRSLKVLFNYHVYLREDDHYYSVPYKHVGKQIMMLYTGSIVEIYHNNVRIALHKRDRSTNKYTTLSEHMPPHHRFYAKWSPQKLINWGNGMGENVRKMTEGMLSMARHPEQAFRSCMGLLNLSRKYGNERVNKACGRALAYDSFSYKKVKMILEKGLDMERQTGFPEQRIPDHNNIRGADYYH